MGLLISINGAEFRPFFEVRSNPPSIQAKGPADGLPPIQRQLDHPDAFENLLKQKIKPKEHQAYEAIQRSESADVELRHAVYAKDLMTTSVKVIEQSASVKEAKQLLGDHSFRHLPVVNENNQVVGMITDRSFLQAQDSYRISEVMSQDLLVAEPNTPLHEMIRGMLDLKVHSVPILNQEKHPVGIVTNTDILKSLLKNPSIDLWI